MVLSLRLLEPAASKADVPMAEGLHAALRLVYGEAAAYGVLDDIGALSQARRRALGVQLGTGKEAAAAAAALEMYYSVLCALARPFSSAVADDLGAAMPALPFGWKSGLEGATEVALSASLTVERAAVLFNLAAAHCACGALLPRTDAEQIKTAARHFQVAAGILDELAALDAPAALGPKPPPPAELQPEIARALSLAMLARAQECFCDKAEADGMAAGTRIKLLLGCRDAYAAAATAICTVADASPSAAPLKRFKAWAEPPCRAKQHAAEAQALWLAATPTNPTPPVGMALALAARAHAAAERAAAAAADLPDEAARRVVADLAGEIGAAVARLGRENDTVYYESVPSEESLPALQGKVLAKAVPIVALFETAEAQPLPPGVWGGNGGAAAAGADEPVAPAAAALFLSLTGLPRASKSAIAKLAEADAATWSPRPQDQPGGFLRGLWASGIAAAGGTVTNGPAGGDSKSGTGGDASRSKNEQVSRVQEILARGREQRGEAPASKTASASGRAGSGAASEDAALQAAIAASLCESSTGSAPTPPLGRRPSATPKETPTFSNLLRRPGQQPSSGSAGPPPAPPPPYSRGGPAPPPPPYTGGGESNPPPPSFEVAIAAPTAAAVDAMLAQLSALGVGRDRAADALRRANYDMAAAADLLFGG